MRPRVLFLLSFLLYSFYARAQAYEPGLLVRSNGDTLRGEIENGFWVEPPTFIRYRSAPDKPGELFLPRQLRAVKFTGGRYFRYEILPLDHAAETRPHFLAQTPLNHVDVGSRELANIKVDSLLAEVLVEGPASLLKIAWPSATHYVIYCPDQPLLELSERRNLRQAPNGTWATTDVNNYQGQLQMYFGKCPAASSAARAAPFTAAGLGAVIQAYNETCSLPRQPGRSWLAQAQPRRRMAFQGGLLAGLRFNRIEGALLHSTGDTGECVDCKLRPFAGLYAELFQPSRTVAIYGELSMSRFQSRGDEDSYFPQYSRTTFDYQAWLGTARVGTRFFFPRPNERQWLVTLAYELNRVLSPNIVITSGPDNSNIIQNIHFAGPTALPGIGLGWRSRRLTLSLDEQLYQDSFTPKFANFFVGTNFALRAGVSYRLGGNPDVAVPRPTAQP